MVFASVFTVMSPKLLASQSTKIMSSTKFSPTDITEPQANWTQNLWEAALTSAGLTFSGLTFLPLPLPLPLAGCACGEGLSWDLPNLSNQELSSSWESCGSLMLAPCIGRRDVVGWGCRWLASQGIGTGRRGRRSGRA